MHHYSSYSKSRIKIILNLKYLYIKNIWKLKFKIYGVALSIIHGYDFFVFLNVFEELI